MDGELWCEIISVLSRSVGGKDILGARFVERIRRDGVQIEAPACDISNLSILQATVKGHIRSLPPIKGCIQASTVLHVSSLIDALDAGLR